MALIKASSVRAGHVAMRRQFGDAAFSEAVSRLSEDDQAAIRTLDHSAMYPLAVDGRLELQLVEIACGGSRSLAERAFREAAGIQADGMLDGVFSVFARFVSPKQAFDKAGTILASVYTGVSSETKAAEDGTGGLIIIRGLGELPYARPWLSGWMEHALVRFGAKMPRVNERSWQSGKTGSDELVFEVTWL